MCCGEAWEIYFILESISECGNMARVRWKSLSLICRVLLESICLRMFKICLYMPVLWSLIKSVFLETRCRGYITGRTHIPHTYHISKCLLLVTSRFHNPNCFFLWSIFFLLSKFCENLLLTFWVVLLINEHESKWHIDLWCGEYAVVKWIH